MTQPEAVADDGHALGAGVILAGEERAALVDGDPEHAEEVGRHLQSADVLRIARRAESSAAETPRRQRRAADLSHAIEIVGIGERPLVAKAGAEVGLLDHADEPFRFGIGERPEEHAVDHGEHHRRRADSQRERGDRDRGEPDPLPERAHGVPDVLHQIVHPACTAGVAALLLHLLRAADRDSRTPLCLDRIDPLLNELGGVLVDVKPQLLLELGFQLRAFPQPVPPRHFAPPSDNRRITPIASDKRRQLAVSDSSMARPFRVRR